MLNLKEDGVVAKGKYDLMSRARKEVIVAH